MESGETNKTGLHRESFSADFSFFRLNLEVNRLISSIDAGLVWTRAQPEHKEPLHGPD